MPVILLGLLVAVIGGLLLSATSLQPGTEGLRAVTLVMASIVLVNAVLGVAWTLASAIHVARDFDRGVRQVRPTGSLADAAFGAPQPASGGALLMSVNNLVLIGIVTLPFIVLTLLQREPETAG